MKTNIEIDEALIADALQTTGHAMAGPHESPYSEDFPRNASVFLHPLPRRLELGWQ